MTKLELRDMDLSANASEAYSNSSYVVYEQDGKYLVYDTVLSSYSFVCEIGHQEGLNTFFENVFSEWFGGAEDESKDNQN